MSEPRIVPLLLAGGAGTRLWPVSRDAMPKQFLPLAGERSTFQQALARVAAPDLFAPPIVLTAHEFRFFARAQVAEPGVDATIVLEPQRRDSGPAIVAGAALVRQADPEALVLTLAADHVILDTALFHAACRAGREAAGRGHLCHLRYSADRPENVLRLYQGRCAARSRRLLCGRRLYRKTGCGNGGTLCRRGLSMEFGQLSVSGRHAARRTRPARAGDGAGGCDCSDARQNRSRFCPA